MKLQDLNRSFGKVLGALAVALMIQTGSAQAQQGQWAEDGCFYTAVFSAAPSGAPQGSMQMVRRGCAVQSPDGQARYYDLGTGQLYLMENNPSQQGSKVGKIFKSLIASHKQVIQALQARRADSAPMDPQAMQQGANPVPMIPQGMQQGAYSATMIPQGMQQGAYSATMIPQATQQAAYSATVVPQATQQGANPVPMIPQGMQQGAYSATMVPQTMQQAAYSATVVPQATQQGANPYFAVPYAVVGGAPVGGGPVTSSPNVPAGNLGLPSSGPDPAIKPQGKQSRSKAIKAQTAPSCVAGSVGCQ